MMRYFAVAPIKLGMVAFRDPQPKIALVAKVTYRITGGAAPGLALESRPLPLVMEATNASGAAQHGEDFVPRKLAVDVTVVGNLQRSDPSVTQITGVSVGPIRKRLRVVTAGHDGSPLAGSLALLPLDSATLVDEAGARATLGPRALNLAGGSQAWNALENAWADSFLTLAPDETGQSFQTAPWDQQSRDPIGPGSPICLEQLFNPGIATVTLPHVVPWILLLPPQLRVDLAPSIQRLRPRLDTLHFDTAERTLEVVHRVELPIGSFEEVPDVLIGLGPVDWFPNAAAAFDVVRSSTPELVATRRNASPTIPRVLAPEISKRGATNVGGRRRAGTEIMPRVAMPVGPPQAPDVPDTLSRDTAVMNVQLGSTATMARPQPSTVELERSTAITTRAPVAAGEIVVGPWRVSLERGHADRWVGRAVHESTGRTGVAHLEPPNLPSNLRGELLDKAELFSSVSHAAIRAIVDRGVLPDGRSYVIEASPKGQSIAVAIAHNRDTPWPQIVHWVEALLDAVMSFHGAGLAMTVADPSNLFLEDSRCMIGWTPLLRPFGDPSEPGDFGYVLAPFAAPELASGDYAEIGAETDVWSIGALLYWLLAGEPPHGPGNPQRTLVAAASQAAPSLSARGTAVPKAIVDVVDRALCRAKASRFADAAAFAAALRAGQNVDPGPVETGLDRTAKTERR